jgi:hypothetical protein
MMSHFIRQVLGPCYKDDVFYMTRFLQCCKLQMFTDSCDHALDYETCVTGSKLKKVNVKFRPYQLNKSSRQSCVHFFNSIYYVPHFTICN